MSNEIYKSIEELLDGTSTVDRHSYFQLKHFIIGKEPTTQARLWRCVKELQSRKDAIDATMDDIEEAKDNLELNKLEISEIQNIVDTGSAFGNSCPLNELEEAKKAVILRKLNRNQKKIIKTINDLEKKLKFTYDEAKFFLEAFNSLSVKETIKPFDDFESQTEYWSEKLSQEFNLRILLQSPLDIELVKTTLALPKSEAKDQMVGLINSIQESKRYQVEREQQRLQKIIEENKQK